MNGKIVEAIQDFIYGYVKESGANGAVVGMSGGKDSLVVAKLCANALGAENVLGVIIPNGEMKDRADAIRACEILDIPHITIKIRNIYEAYLEDIQNSLSKVGHNLNQVSKINFAPRLRMSALYAIAGSINFLVANTSNLSEASVGYTTKFGDNAGDFAPLLGFTKTEVCQLGEILKLPTDLINKIPNDGLSGISDETKLGFTYDELDNLIRTGEKGAHYDLIIKKYLQSKHKREPMPYYKNNKINFLNKI